MSLKSMVRDFENNDQRLYINISVINEHKTFRYDFTINTTTKKIINVLPSKVATKIVQTLARKHIIDILDKRELSL